MIGFPLMTAAVVATVANLANKADAPLAKFEKNSLGLGGLNNRPSNRGESNQLKALHQAPRSLAA